MFKQEHQKHGESQQVDALSIGIGSDALSVPNSPKNVGMFSRTGAPRPTTSREKVERQVFDARGTLPVSTFSRWDCPAQLTR